MNKHEQKFYTALSDLFVGAEVDGVGGFIKLMKFKRQYYQSIEKLLKLDIYEALKKQPSFREDLFDKLYQFFSLYFTQNGCIYFNHTPFHNQIYDKVYNGKDVALFWKTNMLYYVKSDKLWRSLPIKHAGYDFYIDATELEQKANNTKNGLVYAFKDVTKTPEGKPQINFVAKLSSNGNKTKIDEIRKDITKQNINLSDEDITKLFAIFEKQNEVDFFINKDAKAFLSEQFKLWIYQYFYNGSDDWSEPRVQQLMILKNIANKVINFIGQFEEELVKIWNKPKFVRNSNYVVTLDKLIAKGLDISLLINHTNIEKQIQEWKDLGIVKDDFNISEITVAQDMFADSKYKYLPFDTKHFDLDIKYAILALFDNLDEECDGVLIKSDNYQALNTIMPKYRQRVKCIYIDPPYNTAASEIIYVNNYKHSSWLSLIENRLFISNLFLTDDGVIQIAIDDVEQRFLSLLMDNSFGSDNFIANISIEHNAKGIPQEHISATHEYLIIYAKNISYAKTNLFSMNDAEVDDKYTKSDKNGKYRELPLTRTGSEPLREDRPYMFFPFLRDKISMNLSIISDDEYKQIYDPISNTFNDEFINQLKDKYENKGYEFILPKNAKGTYYRWKWGIESCRKGIQDNQLIFRNNTIYNKSRSNDKVMPKSLWHGPRYDATSKGTRILKNLFNEKLFDYPKSIFSVMDAITIGADNDSIVLDYFAGSGTTAHAVINLNRKWGSQRKYILVEQGEHFNTVVVPRTKKVIFSEKWKDGKAQDNNGISQLVKYYELEQYEEALAKCKYKDHEVFDEQSPYSSYVFMADEKLLTDVVSITNKQVKIDLSKLYPDIDVAETLSNLLGKKIAKQSKNSVTFTDGDKIDLTNLDLDIIKPLLWWS